MGPADTNTFLPKVRVKGDQFNRSLIATAAILAIASLIACWSGTQAVVEGIVNFEGRESSRLWASAFAHTLSQSADTANSDPIRPYSAGANPEKFKALDNAVFDGQILTYRIYNTGGQIVASSDFQEIGKKASDPESWEFIKSGDTHGRIVHVDDAGAENGPKSVSHAIAPLVWNGQHRGAIEVEVDVSTRVIQLNRLRYIAFAALAVLLTAVIGILNISIFRTLKRHRQAQREIERSERQYRLLLDGAPDSMLIHDQKQVLYVNAAAVTLHGAERAEDLLTLDPMMLVPPDKRDTVRENRRAALANNEVRKSEALGRWRLDETVVETDSMGIPIEWDGKPCLLIQSRDMSEQRATQRDIAFREAQLSAFMEHTQAMMFIADTEGRVLLVNRRYEEFHGVSLDEIKGRQPHEWAGSELAAVFAKQDREVLETGKPQSWESTTSRPDGENCTIRDEIFPIRDDRGLIIGIGGISTDITDIREREDTTIRALAAAERAKAELTAFLDSSPSAMYLKDRDLRLTMVNRAYEQFYGRGADKIVGKPARDWMPRQLADEIEMMDLEILRSGEPMSVEMEVKNADGEIRNIEFGKYPIFAEDGSIVGISGFNSDLTESRRQQAEILESQARLSAYFDHVPMIVVLVDRQSRILMANNRYCEFFGTEPDEVCDRADFPWLDAEQQQIFDQDNRSIFENGDVIERVVEVRNSAGENRLLHQVKFPIRSEDAGITAIGGFMSDITEQKLHERELEDARDEAEAANRAKSAFLANMSHEIRTPMNGVFGMADLLAQSRLSTDQRRYLDTIKRSGEALLGVINNVLDVSRIEAGEFRLDHAEFRLDELIADSVEMFAETASAKGITIAHHISKCVPNSVRADEVRLRQVLINLIGNAVKFTSEGQIVVRAVRVGGDEHTSLVRFEVSDTGIGIPREKQVTLFDPFQQADTSITRKFGGTGLGLSIAQHIVGLMGGRIDVDSVPDAGSSFVFSVPLALGEERETAHPDQKRLLAGKKILIVDDNSVNREILTAFTKDWDMDATIVPGAEQAQAAWRDAARSGDTFDIALLDILMPGMNGIELACWIRQTGDYRSVPLVALTSFNWDRDSAESKEAGFCQFATKPVRRQELERILAEALMNSDNPGETGADDDAETAGMPDQAIRNYGVRILLAEDNPVNQELGREYFARLGCKVTVADNGLEAVKLFARDRFDLVLMDVQMPEMDGIQATIQIRDMEARDASDRIPIIAATAHAFQEDREKCILAGMDDFLSKPYTRRDILPIMDRWIGSGLADSAAGVTIEPEAGPASVESRLLDADIIEQLRSMDTSGEDRIFRKVAQIFIDTTPEQLEKAKQHLQSEDFAGMAMVSHGLKTAAANVAALSLSAKFKELELASREEDIETCRRVTGEILALYGDVVAALNSFVGAEEKIEMSA